jgi:hypothetical protein
MNGFIRLGMTTTGIGPKPSAMILLMSALMQKHFAFGVENENGKSSVQLPSNVGFHFVQHPNGVVISIYQYYLIHIRKG